ncbi:hypothetical protein [Achromobacter sp. DH1f]|uniref:hypothetical protein n=1 Tax=Achromobacter sp. DH1f TaxID=1397275 RepID=UPI000469F555|nr:hypothetical protein [Achromobacter sp. DH1f]
MGALVIPTIFQIIGFFIIAEFYSGPLVNRVEGFGNHVMTIMVWIAWLPFVYRTSRFVVNGLRNAIARDTQAAAPKHPVPAAWTIAASFAYAIFFTLTITLVPKIFSADA